MGLRRQCIGVVLPGAWLLYLLACGVLQVFPGLVWLQSTLFNVGHILRSLSAYLDEPAVPLCVPNLCGDLSFLCSSSAQ
jgi:hypothetical protein